MFSVAMIGAGIIGEKHLAAVAACPETTLCAVADIVPRRAEAAGAPYGAAAYTDYEELLLREKPDAVIINLPHGLHEACVLACAAAGTHMLLEKPMSVSAASCHRMNEACEKAGVLLQVGHVQRYIPQNRAARAIVEGGALGPLVMVSDLRTNNYFTPQRPAWFFQRETAGGGIWMNYGAHSLDKLCYLAGSPVAQLTGRCTWARPGTDVDGSAQVLAGTASGVTASITLCGYSVVPTDETMLYFTRGALRLHTGSGLWQAVEGKYEAVDTGAYPGAFHAQWADFVQALQTGRVLHCNGAYAAAIVGWIESIWQ